MGATLGADNVTEGERHMLQYYQYQKNKPKRNDEFADFDQHEQQQHQQQQQQQREEGQGVVGDWGYIGAGDEMGGQVLESGMTDAETDENGGLDHQQHLQIVELDEEEHEVDGVVDGVVETGGVTEVKCFPIYLPVFLAHNSRKFAGKPTSESHNPMEQLKFLNPRNTRG